MSPANHAPAIKCLPCGSKVMSKSFCISDERCTKRYTKFSSAHSWRNSFQTSIPPRGMKTITMLERGKLFWFHLPVQWRINRIEFLDFIAYVARIILTLCVIKFGASKFMSARPRPKLPSGWKGEKTCPIPLNPIYCIPL